MESFRNWFRLLEIGWCWGEIIKEDDARSILKEALDNGVNFDTSDTYGDGGSERFLSEILKTSTIFM